MSTLQIAPSILSADFAHLEKEIKAVEKAGADRIHLDVMDGVFVPNLSFGPPIIKKIRPCTSLPFDAHLMVQNPTPLLKTYIEAGCNMILLHHESEGDIKEGLKTIRSHNIQPGITINPDTPTDSLKDYLPLVDCILIMSVHPGFSGQKFIPECLDKIKETKKLISHSGSNISVMIDGGVKASNIKEIYTAGADISVFGSEIYGSSDYIAKIEEIRHSLYTPSV